MVQPWSYIEPAILSSSMCASTMARCTRRLQYSAPAQLLCIQAQNSARIKENTTKHQDLKADEAPEQQIVVPEHTQRFHHRP